MLRNYDPLVRELTALHGAVDRLRERPPATRVAPQWPGREPHRPAGTVTEQFKSSNALLQNSSLIFGLLQLALGEDHQTNSNRLRQVSILSALWPPRSST